MFSELSKELKELDRIEKQVEAARTPKQRRNITLIKAVIAVTLGVSGTVIAIYPGILAALILIVPIWLVAFVIGRLLWKIVR